MSDENTPTTDENAKPPEQDVNEATNTHSPKDVPPPLPPSTVYAEPSTMAETAGAMPAVPPSTVYAEPEAMAEAAADIPAEEPPVAETPAAEESKPLPMHGEPPAPKPKKPRKSKSAATGADGPTDAPASTDPNAAPAEAPGESKKKWYVVKIQSGREDSIKAAIERKVKIEGLEQYFGQIAIPVEEIVVKKSVKVKDKKTGDKVTQEKKVIKHQKKYPGYLFAEVEFNDRILYLFRETSGVGDFVGAGMKREPTPMTDREVTQMLTGVVLPGEKGKPKGPAKVKLDIEKGDKVKIRDGAFANMEGEVKGITEAKDDAETPKVTVVVTIFGRPVEVELDYWHVDKV
jgi:transcriptional antiterminator NusG